MPQSNIKSVTAKADISESGSITGYAATFTREPDFAGDVIAKGAFSKFLARMADEGTVMPLLYNHDQSLGNFIGKVTSIEEDDHGLLFTAEFDATDKAQRARELAMDGRLSKFSFAYVVRDQGEVTLEDGRKANELRELDVDEVSLVLMPCNPDTSVVEVKGADTQVEITERLGSASRTVTVKAGRRNSKADEDAIRQAIALLQGVLGEVPEEDHDTPGEGDQNDANDADGTTEGGAGEAMPKGREEATEDIEAYRKKALLSAYGITTDHKEGKDA